ncbi:synaptic vesicle 2-related protein [Plakobranchus ocellatus]|uniref:Synaptic vesicle 2-related protein n=1 Tax=Plakobranchus ocellatus TaxID=259542 RepID=A0AAV4D0F3_9GAST|nr:synaptic vesicle 2-related protein [Plakobranchus ocellatus]
MFLNLPKGISGTCSGLARIGAVVTPYLAQVGTEFSAYLSFSIYGVVGLTASMLALLLPFDTRGRAMADSAH